MWKRDIQVARRLQALLEQGFVILDLETTGLADDPNVGIVEIGVIDHQGTALMNTLVKPGTHISLAAMQVHGIQDRDVAGAPAIEKVFPELAEHLADKTVVAYNAPFEQQVLKKVTRREKLAAINPAEWVCAMRTYSEFIRTRRWQRLEVACRHEGIAVDNAHRALGDCRLTLALIQAVAGYAEM